MDVYSFLNGILDDLGMEQNAEDWATDPIRPGFRGLWSANLPGTRTWIEVYVEHFSADATGYTVVSAHEQRADGKTWAVSRQK